MGDLSVGAFGIRTLDQLRQTRLVGKRNLAGVTGEPLAVAALTADVDVEDSRLQNLVVTSARTESSFDLRHRLGDVDTRFGEERVGSLGVGAQDLVVLAQGAYAFAEVFHGRERTAAAKGGL